MAKRSIRDAAASLFPPSATGSATALLDPPAAPAEPAPVYSSRPAPSVRRARGINPSPSIHHHTAILPDEHGSNHQAELFYLQKQIQLQTQMVFILEDQTRIQGVVEWYDRNSIKVRGKSRVLIYKSAIKYLYKAGELGTNSD
jgi:sRNA-binding regulator protein Hfq